MFCMFDRQPQMSPETPTRYLTDTDAAVTAIVELANQNRAQAQLDPTPSFRSRLRHRMFGHLEPGTASDPDVVHPLADLAIGLQTEVQPIITRKAYEE